jgi:hypothetical protein
MDWFLYKVYFCYNVANIYILLKIKQKIFVVAMRLVAHGIGGALD